MQTRRLLVLAMVGAIMTGTFATAVPAMAEGNSTTVTLSVEPKNTYTMTVPATTALNSNGDITALTNGVTISSDNDMASDYAVNVTVSSAHNWTMEADGREDTIGYTLYSDEAGTIEMNGNGTAKSCKLEVEKEGSKTTTASKGLWFTADEANKTTAKPVYAKVDALDVANAASGDYQDTITFTAKAGRTVVATIKNSNITNRIYYYTVLEGTTWGEITVSRLEELDKRADGELGYDHSGWIYIEIDGENPWYHGVDDPKGSHSILSKEYGIF